MTYAAPASIDGPAVESVVLIVEDDLSIRNALRRLFTTMGQRVLTFGSASELLESALPDVPSCLILDIRLPGRSGLDLQAELGKAGAPIPIIFMTGHGDISMSVRAMKAGALDFLTKPFRDQDMLDAVAAAIARDRARRADAQALDLLRSRFDTLNAREKDVMRLATSGLMNKQIAWEIGLTEMTVKMHRGNVMRKMSARSIADLVRMADGLDLRHADSPTMRP